MKLSISVMCHPKRAKYLPYLFSKLGQVPVAMDKQNSIVDTCQRAWALYMPSATWHCVVQDDAIVCKDFRVRAEQILVNDKMAYNFYYGNKPGLEKQQEQGKLEGFIIKHTPNWGVAICLPTRLIPAMLTHYAKLTQPQDDVRISDYLVKNKVKVYFPLPSLIDHRHNEISLIGNTGRERKAFWFIGED